jgi:hypothetical protein
MGFIQYFPFKNEVLPAEFGREGGEGLLCLMLLNATFNNISLISWRSVLLVEETGVPVENY